MDELNTIVLTHDIKAHDLKKGDIGTIVHSYKKQKAIEVEFLAASGKTIALLTLNTKDVRTLGTHEILHAREFPSA